MEGVKIIGVGAYCPEKKVSNDDLAKLVDTSDEWIIKRTGIKYRRISEGENTSHIGAKAALNAIENANISKDSIDLIITATTSPDSVTPSTACRIQELIGCKNAVAFDISAACSGFLYATIVASNLIKANAHKNVLVIGAEVLSKLVDWNDRGTCILFGDGAAAAVLQYNENGENSILESVYGSDGENCEKYLYTNKSEVENFLVGEQAQKKYYMSMDGKGIFKFAVNIIPQVVNELIEKANLEMDDIKYIIPHQANYRIIKDAARKLKVNEEKFYINLDNFGNTSAASVPIALDEVVKKGLLKKGDKVILVAFGGGLTWAGILIEW